MSKEVRFFRVLTWALVVVAICCCLGGIILATPSYCVYAVVPYVGAQFTKREVYDEFENVYIRIRQLIYVIGGSFLVAGIFWWIHQTMEALTRLSATTGVAPRGIVSIIVIIALVAIYNNTRE